MFDIESFVHTESEAEVSTEYQPIPEGEYLAMIKPDSVEGKSVGENQRPVLNLLWEIQDTEVTEAVGRNTVRQTVWLDAKEDGTGLDFGKGKNVQLGRLLEAVGLRGKAWSPKGLEGLTAIINVKHRMVDDNTYEDVKSVSAA